MTTEEALNLLSQQLDGPLPADQQALLDGWLAESPDHRILAEAFQSQHTDLQHTFEPRRAAAQQTAVAVLEQLAPAPIPSERRGWRAYLTTPLPAAIAAVLLIAVGLYWFQSPKPSDPKTTTVAANDPYGLLGMKPRLKPAAPPTTTLAVGERLATNAGEKRRVKLPDGSVVYLNQNTTVELAKDRQLKLLAGDVFVEAIPADTKPGLGQMTVETPKRVVKALGTMFAVSAKEQGTGVLVTQGKVEVSGLNDKLTTGQELLPDNTVVTAPRVATALEWTRELMVAAESPLIPAGKHRGGSLVAVDPYGQEAKLGLVKYHVDVHIEDGFARTTIDQTYFNSENWQLEGTFYFPLPPDASLSRLAMYVEGERMEGGMAEREHARNMYETIRYQRRDPALLEWVDGSVFKMRVFPLEARQEKRIILSYTQKLPVVYGQSTYRFPAGHSLAVVNEWSFHAFVKGGGQMAAAAPSHPTMKLKLDGGDLHMNDAAKNAKVDQDVVLTLTTHEEQPAADVAHWSSAEADGQKYLLLRYRPHLPTTPKRERRDWVFLFESSGNRDPLVARTQVEVIRSLLTRAEHDDTFTILRVGTRVRSYSELPLPATIENVDKALAWLDQSHLIGALNLDQALSTATPILQQGRNPHLVHVGGGIASIGEQRADELVKRVPAGTKYIGIAVGKRFSPALMKTAAEKTGGLFTQINPDEPISWRGFELASTLNAPRLLNVKIDAEGQANTPRFLTFSNILTHGEELAAVANVTDFMPTFVKITGLLDGTPVERSVRVDKVAPKADYLPRTWAKLEIDRLLADNSQKHKKQITDLSKAMYVMTPFTSLLVLENEQMYRDFKVDRGRQDHWAMYDCPAKIPVVYIPDPNQPASGVNLKGQKPHASQVQQTLLTRPTPRFLTYPNYQEPSSRSRGTEFYAHGLNLQHDLYENSSVTGGGDSRGATRLKLTNRWDLQRKELEVYNEMEMLHDQREVLSKSLADLQPAGDHLGVELTAATTFDREENIPVDAPLAELQSVRFADELRRFNVRQRFDRPRTSGGASSTNGKFAEEFARREVDGLMLINEDLAFDPDLNDFARFDSFNMHGEVDRKKMAKEWLWSEMDRDSDEKPSAKSELLGRMSTAQLSRAPSYYGRIVFSNQTTVFSDLVSYAPGLNTSAADRRATVEAEALPRFGRKRGTIDPAALTLINAARPTTWYTTTVKLNATQSLLVRHDMQGRYTYERVLPLGLKELVVCDGQTLWHLYPEIGLGAKRQVSRYHRDTIKSIVPDFVPPANELNDGYDVQSLDAKTVALVPHKPTNPDEQPKRWLQVHLVIEGHRLVERQIVLMPTNEVVARYTYDGRGTVAGIVPKRKDEAKETVKELVKHERTASRQPDLSPDVSKLVVLPLPWRDRSSTYAALDMDANQDLNSDRNACYEYLNEEAQMRLIACEFASGNGYNVHRLANKCFHEDRHDRRVGFFVLALAANHDPRRSYYFEQECEVQPTHPLLQYINLYGEPTVNAWTMQFGFGVPSESPTDFLGRLRTFRTIQLRWQSGYIRNELWGQRDEERRRALAFAVANANNPLGWCVVSLVQDQSTKPDAFLDVAKTWSVLVKQSGLPYEARYEEARCLGLANKHDEAQVKYQGLFREALTAGVLPPLDSSFRSILERGKQETWAKLMQETAAQCAAKKARPVIVTLAWQCNQLGDTALADVLLSYALKDVSAEEKPHTTLAAVYYLNHTGRHDRADQLIRDLLSDETLAQSAVLWRLASSIADSRGDTVRSVECLERALDREFDQMPDVFNVQPIRNDYGRLLSHYEWLADASKTLSVAVPNDLVNRVVKATDRWRTLDQEAHHVCERAAKILRTVGGEGSAELAWDYATTPLAMRPNESSPWLSLAHTVRQEGRWQLADQCYDMAFQAEPTNAQLLWDRAQLLIQQGQTAQGHALLKSIVDQEWQPRFDGLKAQARTVLEGR